MTSFDRFCTTLELETQALAAARARLMVDPRAQSSVKKAVDQIVACSRAGRTVWVVGLGKSGLIARKIASTLSSLGVPALYLHPTEALHGDLGAVRSGDAALALSQSGNSDELISLLGHFKQRAIPWIAICGNKSSRLVEGADAWLDSSVEREACPHKLAPTSSTTLALALGDALALAASEALGFDSATFAQHHPGGGLGRRLNARVRDLMHSGERCPKVVPDASIEEVIEVSTQGRLGAVCVVQSAHDATLRGVITDGDLRRALKKRDSFFSLKAKDVMGASPVTVQGDVLATDALELMERRTHQISVLPVVNSKLELEGLLRLHDLLQSF